MITLEQIQQHITDAADPVKAPAALLAIRDGVIEMEADRTNLTNRVNDLSAQNEQLRDVNMQLFLRVGGEQQEDGGEHEPTREEILKSFYEQEE